MTKNSLKTSKNLSSYKEIPSKQEKKKKNIKKQRRNNHIKNLKQMDLCSTIKKENGTFKVKMNQDALKKHSSKLSKKLFKRRIWTNEEQNYLCYLVNQIGIPLWTKICSQFNNQFPTRKRTNKQIRERYHNYLRGGKLELQNKLTTEELLKLFDNILEHETSWVRILKNFPTRTENIVKNYYSKFSRNCILFINEILTKHQTILEKKFHITPPYNLDAQWLYSIYNPETFYPLIEIKEIIQQDFKMFVERFILSRAFIKAGLKRYKHQTEELMVQESLSKNNLLKKCQLSQEKGAVKRRNDKFRQYSQIVESFFKQSQNEYIKHLRETLKLQNKSIGTRRMENKSSPFRSIQANQINDLNQNSQNQNLLPKLYDALNSRKDDQSKTCEDSIEPISSYFKPFNRVRNEESSAFAQAFANQTFYQIQSKNNDQIQKNDQQWFQCSIFKPNKTNPNALNLIRPQIPQPFSLNYKPTHFETLKSCQEAYPFYLQANQFNQLQKRIYYEKVTLDDSFYFPITNSAMIFSNNINYENLSTHNQQFSTQSMDESNKLQYSPVMINCFQTMNHQSDFLNH